MKKLSLIVALLVASSTFIACGGSGHTKHERTNTEITQDTNRQFGIFKVLRDNHTIEMDGDIKSSSLNNFNRLIKTFPDVDKINIINCGGSLDDETNLKLSKKVHEKGISTHLMDNGEIASGGVDFFLAGVKRTKGKNTKIGVHSWSGDGEEATHFHKGHKYHQPYIDYYKSVGFTQKQAEDFYYFTIHSASADDIHYMTKHEIEKYHILKH